MHKIASAHHRSSNRLVSLSLLGCVALALTGCGREEQADVEAPAQERSNAAREQPAPHHLDLSRQRELWIPAASSDVDLTRISMRLPDGTTTSLADRLGHVSISVNAAGAYRLYASQQTEADYGICTHGRWPCLEVDRTTNSGQPADAAGCTLLGCDGGFCYRLCFHE